MLLASPKVAGAASVSDIVGRWSVSDCRGNWFDISVEGQTVVFNHNNRQTYRESVQADLPDGFLTLETTGRLPARWSYRFPTANLMEVTSSSTAKVITYHRCQAANRLRPAPPAPGCLPSLRLRIPATPSGCHNRVWQSPLPSSRQSRLRRPAHRSARPPRPRLHSSSAARG